MALNAIPQRWRAALAMTAAVIGILLFMYRDTAASIVDIWYRSGTYAHGFLIIPISVWLVWLKRHRLARLTPRASFWPLAGIAALAVLWSVAHAIEVVVVQQLCLVAMLILAVIAVLGWRVSRTIAFPLGFLFFAVPMGEDLIHPLMQFTAAFTVKALQITGIPVLWEGMYITLPNGQWQVAEACSGVRYLIASMTLGFLYAYLTYASYLRRGVFIVISAIVPIIANGLRAYMIVMIGYLSGMKLATGVDHIIYGWLFFGLVIGILFFLGSLWREDPHAGDSVAGPAAAGSPTGPIAGGAKRVIGSALAVAAVALLGPAVAFRAGGAGGPIFPVHLGTPGPAAGWRLSPVEWDWHPRFQRPQGEMRQAYSSDSGPVGLYLEYYRDQRQGAELVDSQNLLVRPFDRHWRLLDGKEVTVHVDGRDLRIQESYLDSQTTHLLVWQWYWIAGHSTVNNYVAKALEAKDKLFDGQTRSAAVIVATPYDIQTDAAERRLQRFVTDMYPTIARSLTSVGRRPTATVTEK